MSIPAGTKFIGIAPGVDTVEKKSTQANSPSNVYTIEDIQDGSVPDTRTITINGDTKDLSADRSWTISTGITVGTTPITSGVAGRVLFEGAGNVVQESARMVFDGSKYVYDGTSVTANASTFEILGAGGQRGLWVFQDNSAKIGGNNNNFITKGTGTGQSTNNFYSNDSHFCFGGVDSSKGWVHVGANNVNPQARLDVRAQGALSTDIAFRVRNSADTYNMLSIDGAGRIYSRGNNHRFDSADSVNYIELGPRNNGQNPYFRVFRNGVGDFGINLDTDNRTVIMGLTGSGKFAIGTGAFSGLVLPNEASSNILFIKNGTAPTMSFADNFQLYSADRGGVAGKASAHFRAEDGTINVIGDLSGFGTSAPGARLDVRAQGALSTDIAFRVRNSADSLDIISIAGESTFNIGTTSGGNYIQNSSSGLDLNTNGKDIRLQSSSRVRLTTNSTLRAFMSQQGNLIFSNSLSSDPASMVGGIAMYNLTAPTGNIIDGFSMYSADIVAGNAAPHFRTENGAIVKVYQETTGVGASTLVSGVGTPLTDTDTFDGYTLKQIVKALRNQGLLA